MTEVWGKLRTKANAAAAAAAAAAANTAAAARGGAAAAKCSDSVRLPKVNTPRSSAFTTTYYPRVDKHANRYFPDVVALGLKLPESVGMAITAETKLMREESATQIKDHLGLEGEDTAACRAHEGHVFGDARRMASGGNVMGVYQDARDRSILLDFCDASVARFCAMHRGETTRTGMQNGKKTDGTRSVHII